MKLNSTKRLIGSFIACAAMLLATASAFADKVVLKNGDVYEGKVIRNDAAVVIIEVKVGDKVEQMPFAKDEVAKVEVTSKPAEDKPADTKKDEAKPAKASKPDAAAKPSEKSDKADKKDAKAKNLTGRPTRVAVLNFGAPRSWQGEIGNTVGTVINAWAWAKAVPMLEKDNVDVVVVRIMSGGGYTLERQKFEDVFEKLYKPRFRTVAWVESAISCAAMSPWNIEEFYMLPEGSIGGCTEWSGDLVASKGFQLGTILYAMEKASALAKRDPKIMRAMQITDPLSANIDEDGNVTWFQDLSGKYVLNRPGQILTLTANDAVKFKFAKGIAATKEELVKVMGLNEFEWAGKEATDFIDQNMRDCDRVEKQLVVLDRKYTMAVNAARGLRGDANKDLRAQEVGKARQALNEMKKWMGFNPNFELLNGRNQQWFEEQDRMLKELIRG